MSNFVTSSFSQPCSEVATFIASVMSSYAIYENLADADKTSESANAEHELTDIDVHLRDQRNP